MEENNQKKETNKKAKYSLICSLISLFIFWWLAIVGISYGFLALKEINSTNEKGKGLAITGILFGILNCCLYFFSPVIIFFFKLVQWTTY